jgi:SNF2 family DNA or RNA helicase
MQDTTVFVNLSDLHDDLPPLNHYQIEVEMDEELKKAKTQLEDDIKRLARHDKRMFKSSIQVGYSFLDSPTIQKEIRDRDTKAVVLRTPTVPMHRDNKIHELIKLAKNEVRYDDRKMIVYTYYTNDGINKYIRDNLDNEGFKVTVLNRQDEDSISCDGTTRRIKKDERELFIREEVAKGTEVLVVNPELVKTGYNLIAFPTILYYQMSYQVYTNRQADRRAWRIGQTKPCKIIYMYYTDSIQADIAGLMATKIVASQAIEGNMDAAGLEAICSSRTAEEELAKKFFEGIRGKVSLSAYDTADPLAV